MKLDKRAQIMAAAEAFFVTRRFHEITMEDVARRAGVGKGTLYRYFRHKEDLFFETAMAGYDALCATVSRQAAETKEFDALLLGVCQSVTDFLARRHRVWHLMQAEERRLTAHRGRCHERCLERRRNLLEAVASVLARGKAIGRIRDDLPLDALAACLLAVLRVQGRETRMGFTGQISTEQIVELFLHGSGR
jgi:AcrR family transcriptional regulator